MNYLAALGLFIFLGSLAGVSIFLARKTKRWVLSAIIATLAASILVQAISYAHLGYFDPFFQIAFITSIVIGFPIALLLAYLALRDKRKTLGN